MTSFVAVGRVTAPHGICGWVKVTPLTDDPDRFSVLKRVFVCVPGSEPREAVVRDTAMQPKFVLLKLEGTDSREAAQALKGAMLQIPEELVPPPAEGEYYYYQLEGLRVETAEGEFLGTLDYVSRTGSNDVYFVRAPDGKEQLCVPALKKAIKKIDLDRGLMVVYRDWIT